MWARFTSRSTPRTSSTCASAASGRPSDSVTRAFDWARPRPPPGVNHHGSSRPEGTMTQPHESRLVGALLVQTAATGLIDAVSYLALGHVFTANMTGNVVFLAFAIAGAPGLSIPRSAVSLGAFLAGAVAGGRLAAPLRGGPQHRWGATAFCAGSPLQLCAAPSAAVGRGSAPDCPSRGIRPTAPAHGGR